MGQPPCLFREAVVSLLGFIDQQMHAGIKIATKKGLYQALAFVCVGGVQWLVRQRTVSPEAGTDWMPEAMLPDGKDPKARH